MWIRKNNKEDECKKYPKQSPLIYNKKSIHILQKKIYSFYLKFFIKGQRTILQRFYCSEIMKAATINGSDTEYEEFLAKK